MSCLRRATGCLLEALIEGPARRGVSTPPLNSKSAESRPSCSPALISSHSLGFSRVQWATRNCGSLSFRTRWVGSLRTWYWRRLPTPLQLSPAISTSRAPTTTSHEGRPMRRPSGSWFLGDWSSDGSRAAERTRKE
jgi:hypothetical protein